MAENNDSHITRLKQDKYVKLSNDQSYVAHLSIQGMTGNIVVDGMIKKLTTDDTWQKMQDHVLKRLNERNWEQQVVAKMTEVVDQADMENDSYSKMLLKLGGSQLAAKLTPEERNSLEYEDKIKKLINLPEFRVDEDQKNGIFQSLSILFAPELEEVYNSVCSGTSNPGTNKF